MKSPGVYTQERDRGLRRKAIIPIFTTPPDTNGGGGGEPSGYYYIYSTNFSSSFVEYPANSGSIGNVWVSGSTNPNHNSFFFIKNDSTLWAVGDNDYGQLGTGDEITTQVIQQVGTGSWKRATVGMMAGAGISVDGKLHTWGSNQRNQLGTGSLVGSSIPIWIVQEHIWNDVSVGEYQALAVRSDGTLWSWGTASAFSEPYNGSLGFPEATQSLSEPTQIGEESDWKSAYAFDRISFAIKNDGSLYGWGRNLAYALGQEYTNITYYTPVLVNTGSWDRLVSDGSTVYAIALDGTLWGWGENNGGSLSSYTDEGTSGAYDATGLLEGGSFTSATNSSTRITTTAGNCTTSSIANNLLGSASLTLSSTPTSTPGIYPVNDEGYWEILLPFNVTYNGTVYNTIYVNTNSFITFGSGYVGFDFDATTPSTDKLFISAWDGYAYRIYYGQEGNTFRIRWEGNTMYDESGDSKVWEVVFYQETPDQIDIHIGENGNWILPKTSKRYPVNILPGTTWKDISMSVYGEVQYEAGGAIKSDGTLWMWGANDLGQLGFGDTTDRIFPTQLGSDTNWRTILRGVTNNFALKDL